MESGNDTQVASQRIADIVAERILRGELSPGTRIKQDALSEELDASRIPVREALRILAARGLVTLRVNAGAWVSEMTVDDLVTSYKIRERLEPLLLEESMRFLTDADKAALREVHVQIIENSNIEQFLVLDRQFHWLTYSRHRVPVLADMVERLWDTTQHYRRIYTRLARDEHAWTINAEHGLMLDAIDRDDVEAASTLLREHIRHTRVELSSKPEIFGS